MFSAASACLLVEEACGTLKCDDNAAHWLEDCIVDYCAGLHETALKTTLAACKAPPPPN